MPHFQVKQVKNVTQMKNVSFVCYNLLKGVSISLFVLTPDIIFVKK